MNTEKQFLDLLIKTPQLYNIFVSPNAKWVAWAWANIGTSEDVYIAKTDGTITPIKITDFKQNTFISSWTEDSKSLIIEHDYDGDERYRIYKIDIEDKNLTSLTEDHPEYFIRGGSLHPNEKYLIYGANYKFKTNEVIEPTIMYCHDLETGERVAIASPKTPGYSSPSLNSLGTHIIYQRNDINPSGVQIWLADIYGNEDKEILNFGDKSKVHASWFPDAKKVLFLTESDTYMKVGIYDIDSNNITWVLDDSSRSIENAYVPYNSDVIVITEIIDAQSHVSFIEIASLKEIKLNLVSTIIPVAPVKDGVWVCKYFNSQQPTDIITYDIYTKKVIKNITNVFEKTGFSKDSLVGAEEYKWISSDNKKIHGWLYRTKLKPKGTIIYVHGGPTGHSEDRFDIDIQFFLSQGFNVLDPNYRGSTGFGLEFQELIKKDYWGGMEQVDILEGIKSIIKDRIAESGKIGITGTSYGGYSSWHAITHFPIKYIKASIPVCGMTDLVVDYNTTRPDLRRYSEEMLGGSPETNPKIYYDRSPINFINNIKGKLLIVQGAKDPNVSPENVNEVEHILKETKIAYSTLIFKDEGHGIRNSRNKKKFLLRSVEFFRNAFDTV